MLTSTIHRTFCGVSLAIYGSVLPFTRMEKTECCEQKLNANPHVHGAWMLLIQFTVLLLTTLIFRVVHINVHTE